ncbi:MAG: fumarylacetoacetate hydrolase family protein, partial [Chloroflexota bacterium]
KLCIDPSTIWGIPGRADASATFASGAHLPTSHFFMQVIEPEFGLKLKADLPPISDTYTQDQVAEAVGAVLPVIEIVDSVYTDWRSVGATALIADNGCHGAWVIGEPVAKWQHLDLASHTMQLFVNDTLNQTGRGAVVLGHPFNALAWLANALSERGLGLKAGDFISTGVCVDAVYDAQPGESIHADFGELGQVSVSFENAMDRG